MPPSDPAARQTGQASSTSAGDAVREVPVQEAPTARRSGSRPPASAAAAAAAVETQPAAAANVRGQDARAGRSPPPPGGRGVRIPQAAVEVFNIAAGSDQEPQGADGPGARRRGPSRSRRGQSVAMSERIADSREEAGLPRHSEAAEYHHARREAGTPCPH